MPWLLLWLPTALAADMPSCPQAPCVELLAPARGALPDTEATWTALAAALNHPLSPTDRTASALDGQGHWLAVELTVRDPEPAVASARASTLGKRLASAGVPEHAVVITVGTGPRGVSLTPLVTLTLTPKPPRFRFDALDDEPPIDPCLDAQGRETFCGWVPVGVDVRLAPLVLPLDADALDDHARTQLTAVAATLADPRGEVDLGCAPVPDEGGVYGEVLGGWSIRDLPGDEVTRNARAGALEPVIQAALADAVCSATVSADHHASRAFDRLVLQVRVHTHATWPCAGGRARTVRHGTADRWAWVQEPPPEAPDARCAAGSAREPIPDAGAPRAHP